MNAAVTAEYGIPGLKWAMRKRGAPACYPRPPHRRRDADERAALRADLDGIPVE